MAPTPPDNAQHQRGARRRSAGVRTSRRGAPLLCYAVLLLAWALSGGSVSVDPSAACGWSALGNAFSCRSRCAAFAIARMIVAGA